MAGNREAMDDLRRILASRNALYEKADLTVDTSGRTVAAAFEELRTEVTRKIGARPLDMIRA